jgi:Bacterial Ig domain
MNLIKSFIALILLSLTTHVMWGQACPTTFTYSGANGAITIGNLPNVAVRVDNIVKSDNFSITVVASKTYTVTNKTLSIPIPIGAGSYSIKFDGNISATNSWCATGWQTVVVTAAAVTCPTPTITLATPTAGAINSATTLTATPSAGASQTVTKVEFFSNATTLLGSATASPYTLAWTPTVTGTYSITAKVTNSCGNTATSSGVSVTPSCPVPTITLVTPPASSINTQILLTVTPDGGSSQGIKQIDFYSGTTMIGTIVGSPYYFGWTPTTAGTYNIMAKITNNCGNTATSNVVSITPSCPTPTITLTAPATTGNLNAPMTLTVATNGGTSQSISKVEYCINGATTPSFTATTSPYSYTWTPNTAGAYSIVAKITNGCGSVATSNAASINIPTAGLCSSIYTNCSTGQLALGLNNFGSDKSYLLFVQGGIKAQKIKVELAATTWPDYVFAPTYQLMPLNKVAEFIQTNHHLPNMPSAKTLEKEGVDVLEIIKKQQEKIEELYLHIIELEKLIKNKQ